MNEMNAWYTPPYNMEEMAAMFRKWSGLDLLPEPPIRFFNPWEMATADFQTSINDYLKMMGMVSLDAYNTLQTAYDTLKTDMAAKEKAWVSQKDDAEPLKKENAKLKKDLKAKEKAASDAEKALQTLKADMKDQGAVMQDQLDTINALEKQIEDQKKTIAANNETIMDLKVQVAAQK